MNSFTLPVLKPIYAVRPCTLGDLEAVAALMNACDMATLGKAEATKEQVLKDWQRPGFNQATDQQMVMASDGSRIAGWVELASADKVVMFIKIYVHPDYQTEGIGEYLYAWAESAAHNLVSQVPTGSRIVIRSYSHAEAIDVWYSALLQAAGMQLIRHTWRMEMTLDVPPAAAVWPEGIKLKVFDSADDKRPIFAARRTAFQDQFGYVERTFEEEYAEWLHRWEGAIVPGLWLLAMDGEAIAGVCMCRASHNSEEDRGWVASVGVLREYRRRGIGEALLLTAFDTFYKMGKKRVGLGVDASSLTGAATLYKRVGMHVDKQFNLYEKELRSGIDLTTHG
jgi:mycothiol synthase